MGPSKDYYMFRVNTTFRWDGIVAVNLGPGSRYTQRSGKRAPSTQSFFVATGSGLPITTRSFVVCRADEGYVSLNPLFPVDRKVDRVTGAYILSGLVRPQPLGQQ